MRLVFAGTPEAAVPSLRALADAGHDIALVLTRPDAPIGRRRVLTPSPVAAAAEDLGIAVHRAARLDDDALARVRAARAELAVIVAYGGLVREPLLSVPPLGWINLHFSLLPRWRGAAPVQHAVIAGDPQIGAGVFQLTAGLDEGDVFDEIRMPLPAEASAGEMLEVLAREGAALLTGVVASLAQGTARAHPQQGEATLAPKLSHEDARIDWTRPRTDVRARILGVTPEPGAHSSLAGVPVKVISIATPEAGTPDLEPGVVRAHAKQILVGTGTEPLVVERVQPAGKPAMDASDWWRGLRSADVRFDTDADGDGDAS